MKAHRLVWCDGCNQFLNRDELCFPKRSCPYCKEYAMNVIRVVNYCDMCGVPVPYMNMINVPIIGLICPACYKGYTDEKSLLS